jgi:hypothetical protein
MFSAAVTWDPFNPVHPLTTQPACGTLAYCLVSYQTWQLLKLEAMSDRKLDGGWEIWAVLMNS